ncbi:MAG: SDR family NAD(P)-dependent oxidoreductase [Elusimicrobia bacterium]|nr:SDR family NAD(P)-dependent oxidoreductase [Elusimicrobiota bacterium]
MDGKVILPVKRSAVNHSGYWKKRSVLVTGAGGFIGSHLCERLCDEGAQVTAFVHYRFDGSWGWLKDLGRRDRLHVVSGDVTDRDSVRSGMEGADVVFHLAALIAIPYSYHAPASYVRTNVEGTLNILQAARELGVKRLVHTSTSEVYGTAQYVPIDEKHPLQGQSPYSASKIGADKMAEAFHMSFGLPVVIVRPFNTFGPRQSQRAIVPTIMAQCLSGGPLKLGNMTPMRDLNFVLNTVDGFLAAATSSEALGKTVNLGSGAEISVHDLAQKIARLAGVSVKIEQERERIRPKGSEVERLLADNKLAQELLGWKPRVSLDQGLQKTWNWLKSQKMDIEAHRYVL